MLHFTKNNKQFPVLAKEMEKKLQSLLGTDVECSLEPLRGVLEVDFYPVKEKNKLDLLALSNNYYFPAPKFENNKAVIKLSDELLKFLLSSETFSTLEPVKVWETNKATIPCFLLDRQRLSNIIHLAEIFMICNTLSQRELESYFTAAQEVESYLEEELEVEPLPYKPYYDWEVSLLKKFNQLNEQG